MDLKLKTDKFKNKKFIIEKYENGIKTGRN